MLGLIKRWFDFCYATPFAIDLELPFLVSLIDIIVCICQCGDQVCYVTLMII